MATNYGALRKELQSRRQQMARENRKENALFNMLGKKAACFSKTGAY